MEVGTANSEANPNVSYFNSKGMWVTYLLIVFFIHSVFMSLPWLSTGVAWTMTNCVHNLIMFILLHHMKGTPFPTGDQGKYRYFTHWEQLDYGDTYSASRKFLTVVPIILFLLASFYSKYDSNHFFLNAFSLGWVIIPKTPKFHGVRLFGINKY